MPKESFSSLDEAKNAYREYWKRNGIEYVPFLDRASFSTYENFKEFVNIYKKRGKSRSADSERYFILLFLSLLEKVPNKNISHTYRIENIKLGSHGTIEKVVDISIELGKKKLLFDIKKNIDNIEKDLFKGIIFKSAGVLKESDKYYLIIWQEDDQSKNKKGVPSHYKILLDDAKENGWIKDYFYFYLRTRNGKEAQRDFKREMEGLKSVFSSTTKYPKKSRSI